MTAQQTYDSSLAAADATYTTTINAANSARDSAITTASDTAANLATTQASLDQAVVDRQNYLDTMLSMPKANLDSAKSFAEVEKVASRPRPLMNGSNSVRSCGKNRRIDSDFEFEFVT